VFLIFFARKLKLKQRQIVTLLDINQSEVFYLLNGRFSYFSEGKLLTRL
jgi:predicted XRE-type DNA-binding protein